MIELMAGWSLEQEDDSAKKHISQRARGYRVAEREDEDALERSLPPEVLQMIFCRLPFPYLRKLQGLSKTWNDLYSSALHSASLQGRLFQTDFLSVSSRWPHFCPVFVTSEPYYHSFWGFNQSTRMWQQLHKRIRRSVRNPNRVGQTPRRILFGKLSGALMCLVHGTVVEDVLKVYHKQLLEVMVVNILTGEYKVLPPLTEAEVSGHPEMVATILGFFPDIEQIQLGLRSPEGFVFTIDPLSEGYKVYLLYEETPRLREERGLRRILVFEYLSTIGAWTAILSVGPRNPGEISRSKTGSTTYFDGSLYNLTLEPTQIWRCYRVNLSHAYCYRSDILNVEIDLLHAWGFAEFQNMLILALVVDDRAYIYKVDKQILKWTVISVSSTDVVQRKWKEGSSSASGEEKEAERKGKKQKEDSSSESKSYGKRKENSSSNPKEDGETSKGTEGVSSSESRRAAGGPKIKSPRFHIVSDSKCVYFWPNSALGQEALIYSVVDREWSTLTIPKLNTGSEIQLLGGCSRPGEEPFALV